MKKLIATCALLTTVSIVSFAQSKQTSHTMSFDAQPNKTAAPAPNQARNTPSAASKAAAEKRAKANQKQYGLTAEQYKGAYQAELEYEMELAQVRAGGAEPGEGQAMQMGMGRDMKLKNVMTPEQYAKYEANHNAARH